MIKVSETESKVTAAKRTIAVKDVMIKDGMLVDENGENVISQIEERLPDYIETFSFKITFELPDEE